ECDVKAIAIPSAALLCRRRRWREEKSDGVYVRISGCRGRRDQERCKLATLHSREQGVALQRTRRLLSRRQRNAELLQPFTLRKKRVEERLGGTGRLRNGVIVIERCAERGHGVHAL